MKRATVYFDSQIHRGLRLKAAETDRSISDLVNDAVKLSLAEDAEDLAAIKERAREPNLAFEDVLKDRSARMKTQSPHYREQVRAIFDKAPFIADLGLVLSDLGPGWCETVLAVAPKHLQQDGYVHAGVQATMADHTAGGAAGTLVRSNEMVLTAEFKINLLRPALGDRLRCRATVLKPGKTLIVAESEVYSVRDREEKLVAKATVTLAPVEAGK